MMCVTYLVTIKPITLFYMSSRSVISGVANDDCYGHGLGFGRFLSYSSTHGTIGGVHGIQLDAIIFEGMPKDNNSVPGKLYVYILANSCDTSQEFNFF